MTTQPAPLATAQRIVEAVEWFTAYPNDRKRPIIPLLQERFGLSLAEACQVCREVNLKRARSS